MPVTGSRSAKVTLPSDEEILITRDFDAAEAPRLEGVDHARADQALVERRRGEVTIAEVDLRVGGAWRFAMIADGGFEVAFHGEYREIVPNERLVQTEVYEGMPDAEALDTMTLTEVDGRTSVTLLVQHRDKESRDAHINSGMEDGLQDALDLLEEVAVSLS